MLNSKKPQKYVEYGDTILRMLRKQEHKKVDEVYKNFKKQMIFKYSWFLEEYQAKGEGL